MGEIYVGQDFKVKLNLGKNLTGFTDAEIWYKKPDGSTGQITATISAANNKKIEADITKEENTLTGNWTFWARIKDANNKQYIGKPFEQSVYIEGKI